MEAAKEWHNPEIHPGAVFVQLTTACNASCVNCPHPFTYGRKGYLAKGTMAEEVWNKILKDLREMEYRNQVGLYLHHEPLLDRSLFRKIRQVNGETEAFAVISTNGALLDTENRRELIEARPRLVHININSAEKAQYEEMVGLNFETVIENAMRFISEAAGKVQVEINCPVLPGVDTERLVRLFPEVKVNTEYWANSRGGLLEGISSRNRGTRFNDTEHCLQPEQNFNILHDGSVILCCLDWAHESKDDFPNIMHSTIFEIYNSGRMKSISREFLEGRYDRYRMCGRCSEEMGFRKFTLQQESLSDPNGRREEELLGLGEERFSRGDIPSAMEIFLRVLEADGTNSRALNNLGVIQWHNGDAPSAMETFQDALGFHPDDRDALGNLAKAVEATGRSDLLRPDLLKALKEAQPESADLAKLLARVPVKGSLLKPGVSIRTEGRVHIDTEWKPIGVGAQFLENAETYHARYSNNSYWKYVLKRGLELSGVDGHSRLRVLDIGSGSGNTVFAAAELLPTSVIFANDISPQLLQILVRVQDRIPQLDGRIEAYCFDLHKDFFADGSFDLILGGAILHHMIDPAAVLRNTARWLRPGGRILLVEPLEVGGHVLAAVYLTLISELEAETDPRLVEFFKAICRDFEVRFGIPRIKPWTRGLDDKWFFHAPFLREAAGKAGLALEGVSPTGPNLENVFRDAVYGHIKAAGLEDVPVPKKMPEILKQFDMEISAEMKKRFVLEGIIILSKPEAGA